MNEFMSYERYISGIIEFATKCNSLENTISSLNKQLYILFRNDNVESKKENIKLIQQKMQIMKQISKKKCEVKSLETKYLEQIKLPKTPAPDLFHLLEFKFRVLNGSTIELQKVVQELSEKINVETETSDKLPLNTSYETEFDKYMSEIITLHSDYICIKEQILDLNKRMSKAHTLLLNSYQIKNIGLLNEIRSAISKSIHLNENLNDLEIRYCSYILHFHNSCPTYNFHEHDKFCKRSSDLLDLLKYEVQELHESKFEMICQMNNFIEKIKSEIELNENLVTICYKLISLTNWSNLIDLSKEKQIQLHNDLIKTCDMFIASMKLAKENQNAQPLLEPTEQTQTKE